MRTFLTTGGGRGRGKKLKARGGEYYLDFFSRRLGVSILCECVCVCISRAGSWSQGTNIGKDSYVPPPPFPPHPTTSCISTHNPDHSGTEKGPTQEDFFGPFVCSVPPLPSKHTKAQEFSPIPFFSLFLISVSADA